MRLAGIRGHRGRGHGTSGPPRLPQDSSQIGLLKELLDLQKDMVVMLLSLLEGEGREGGSFVSVCLHLHLSFRSSAWTRSPG